MRAETTRSAAACAVSLAIVLSQAAWSYPEKHGPFEGTKGPRVFQTHPCRAVEVRSSGADAKRSTVTFARNDEQPRSALMRLVTEPDGAVSMTVVDLEGRIVAGPARISDRCIMLLPAFWADLNGDGREDFIAFVATAFGEAACTCDVGFALSSERGYRITGVRGTMGPGANDFVNLGDEKCRFIHTCLVQKGRGPGRGAESQRYWVYSLLEFEDDRVVLSKADRRFPKWVRMTPGPNHRAATTITAAQKRLLWEARPERIFRSPPRCAEPAPVIASGHE